MKTQKQKTLEYMRDQRFGKGNWDKVMERDGWKCVRCGMTNKEHLRQFGVNLTINHKDHNGRHSKNPNNDIENLEALCLPCHGSKDAWIHGGWATYVPTLHINVSC